MNAPAIPPHEAPTMQLPRVRFDVRWIMFVAAIVGVMILGVQMLKLLVESRRKAGEDAASAAQISAKNEEVQRWLRESHEWKIAENERLLRAQAKATPAPAPARPDDDDATPSLTATDGHVFDAFLRILAEDSEFNPAKAKGSRLVLIPKAEKRGRWKYIDHTDGSVSMVPPDDGQGDTLTKREIEVISGHIARDAGLGEEISAQVVLNEMRRNSKRTVSLATYRPSGVDVSVVQVARDEDELEFAEGISLGRFGREHPDVKALILAGLPGYSKDGRTAYVSFSYSPGGVHGSGGSMIFRYIDGRWVVAWMRRGSNM